MIEQLDITKEWSLFLDRDGVINVRLVDEYVSTIEEFNFTQGALEAIVTFSKLFGKIFVVTNQQGIGKGLMTTADLDLIHQHMVSQIELAGGRIDKIFYCPNLKKDKNINRKPNIGMALQAKKAFPMIDFKKSIMVGDSLTDMEFGFKMKMTNVFISDSGAAAKSNYPLIDDTYPSLYDFSKALKQ